MFSENIQWLTAVIFFVKHSILDVRQGFEYTSVICYSPFGKIEDAKKIDSVAVLLKIQKITTYFRLTLSKSIMIEI